MEPNNRSEIQPSIFETTQEPAPKFVSPLLAIGALVIALFLPALALSQSLQSRGRRTNE